MRATSISTIELGVVHLRPDDRLATLLSDAELTRVVAEVESELESGQVLYDIAIVDTGAPMSVIPRRVWEQCEVAILGEYAIKGIGLPPVRPLPTFVGEIGVWLLSDGERAVHLRPVVHLARSDEVPLLLGVRDVLSQFHLSVDYPRKKACLIGPGTIQQ